MIKDIKTTFLITEYNDRRLERGVPHLRISIFENDEQVDWLWMNNEDILDNKRNFGQLSFLNYIKDDGSISNPMELFEFKVELPFFSNEDRGDLVKKCWLEQYPKFGDLLEDNHFRAMRHGDGASVIVTIVSHEDLSRIYPVYNHISNDFEAEGFLEFKNNDISKISELNGSTAILEGDRHFTENCIKIKETLISKNINILGISELYREPKKLVQLKQKNIANLVIDTTLFNDKVNELVDLFKTLDYSPKRVLFLNETIKLPIDDCKFYKVEGSEFKLREIFTTKQQEV